MNFPKEFTYLRFYITIEFEEDLGFSKLKGSRIRGILGKALHDMSCPGLYDCKYCPNTFTCPYANLFKPELIVKNALVSPPFVVYSVNKKKFISRGESLEIELTIFGKFTDYFNYFIEALYRGQKIGLGNDNIQYKIIRLAIRERNNIVYNRGIFSSNISFKRSSLSEIKDNMVKRLEIYLNSPVRISKKEKGKKEIVKTPSFDELLIAGKRRVNMLNRNIWRIESFEIRKGEFDDTVYKIEDYQIFFNKIFKKNGLGNDIQLSGITGRIRLKGDNLNKIYKLFKALEVLHLGSKTSYGLGKVKVNVLK
jgi:hypothetical protein